MLIQSSSNGHFLSFDDVKHSYILNGNRVPSVTTIIKGGYVTSIGLINWQIARGSEWTTKVIRRLLRENPRRILPEKLLEEIYKRSKKAADKESKKSANIGTLVHDYAYHTEVTGSVPAALMSAIMIHPDIKKIQSGIDAFTAWHKENGDELVASESIVASIKHRYAGKFDRLARRGGKLILSDFKTSNAIYLDQYIQCAAYGIAIREWLGLEVEGYEILRFGKEDGAFQTLLVSKPEELKIFEAQAIRCRDTYEFKKLESDKRWKWGGKK